jgi:hypothetical protein
MSDTPCPACQRANEIGLRPALCSVHFDEYRENEESNFLNRIGVLEADNKALREQAERSNRAMEGYAKRDKELVDKLCDIRDTLKPHLMPLGEWTSGAECAIRQVLGKHFGVDITK